MVSPRVGGEAGDEDARPVTHRYVRTRTSALRLVDLGAIDATAWAVRHAATLGTSLLRLVARGMGAVVSAVAGRVYAAVACLVDGALRPALKQALRTRALYALLSPHASPLPA